MLSFNCLYCYEKGYAKTVAAEFLRKNSTISIHTILTDNGTNQEHHKHAFKHIFDRICEENHIENRLQKSVILGQMDRLNV